tara:strand:+ start:107 stop:364 length:258 start_codon:yes stop_codon:yes gene_type:complete
MSKGLIVLGAFFILSWCWIAYEIWTAPLMPDDFDLKEEDIWPLDERPQTEERWDEDHAMDQVLNDMVKDFTDKDIEELGKTNRNK